MMDIYKKWADEHRNDSLLFNLKFAILSSFIIMISDIFTFGKDAWIFVLSRISVALVFTGHYFFVKRKANYMPSVLEHAFPGIIYNLVYAYSLYFSITYSYFVSQRFLACFYMMLISLVLYRNYIKETIYLIVNFGIMYLITATITVKHGNDLSKVYSIFFLALVISYFFSKFEVSRLKKNLIRDEELRIASDKLREQERLKTVAMLSSGVSHEFGNILNIVNQGLGVIKKQTDDMDKDGIKKSVQIIKRSVEVGTKILKYTRRSSSIKDDAVTEINLKDLVDSLHVILKGQTGEGVVIKNQCTATIYTNEMVLFNVLVNCILNAVQANASIITISDKTETPHKIVIEDDGEGVNPNLSIFDRGITTKEKGQGIGLAISKHNMMEIGGNIELDNPSSPTRFVISLPSTNNVD